jgi:hypothetical protein
MGTTGIYIHAEGMSKILMNIFETNTVDNPVKTNVVGL